MMNQSTFPEKPFSEEVEREGAALQRSIVEMTRNRPLVRGITLDSPTTKDLDDAFWIEAIPTGYTLSLSISDVASCIHSERTPALEHEAFMRGLTLYKEDQVALPMLPTILSENWLSLLERQPRPTVTITLSLNANFSAGEPDIRLTQMINQKRLSYIEADGAIVHPQTEIDAMLKLAYTVAFSLLQLRKKHQIAQSYQEDADKKSEYSSEIIPHEFTLLVNKACASFLATQRIPALYRNFRQDVSSPEGQPSYQEDPFSLAAHPDAEKQPENARQTSACYAYAGEGHERLGNAIYIRLTSPLRRYVDLVNQRILIASYFRQDPPYTLSELERIAAHINHQEQSVEAMEKQYILEAQERDIRSLIAELESDDQAVTRLAALDAQVFYQIIRVLARTHILPQMLEAEICRRFEQQAWQPHDLFILVFRFQNSGEHWQRVSEATLRALQTQPHHAMSILSLGAQQSGWPEPDYTIQIIGPAHAQRHRVSGQITIEGQYYTSRQYETQKKDLAMQQVATELLIRIARVEHILQPLEAFTIEPSLSSVSLQPTVEEKRSQTTYPNAKGILNELEQKTALKATYSAVQAGLAHEPVWSCTCTIILNLIDPIQGSGSSRSKKIAEQQAASQVIDLLLACADTIKKEAERSIEYYDIFIVSSILRLIIQTNT